MLKRWFVRRVYQFAKWGLLKAQKDPEVSYAKYKEMKAHVEEFKTEYERYLE